MKVRMTTEGGFYKDLFEGDKGQIRDFLSGFKEAKMILKDPVNNTFAVGFTMGMNPDFSQAQKDGVFAFLTHKDNGVGKIEVIK